MCVSMWAEIMDDVFTEMKAKIKKDIPNGLNSSFKDFNSLIFPDLSLLALIFDSVEINR